MTDYEKLKSLISEAENLKEHCVTPFTPAFQAWFSACERFLIKRFGHDSFEYKKLKETKFVPSVYADDSAVVRKCRDGLTATKMIFETYLNEMDDDSVTTKVLTHEGDFDKVFIVHGHDSELKLSVARLVEKQGLEAIILNEQANKGKTIIEKFEEHSDVSGAICLFTADDFGRAKADESDQPRARQNVVFEAGYFMGKLSRSRVVIIAEHGVELPSDMQGIVYTDKSNWEVDVLKELKAMGYVIDFNKLF